MIFQHQKNALRLLIVEDEPLIRAGIREDVSSMHSIQVGGECSCAADAIRAIRSGEFDLVLLDIQLPDGTGFDVIREIGPERMPGVIFVTAYDKYAIQAFEVNAVDYLLKPFDENRLRESIERARQRLLQRAGLVRQLEALIEARTSAAAGRLVVRTGERFDLVPVESIDWIESANNYAFVHCGSRDHLIPESLTSLEARLDPGKFVRVHRSHLVNVSRIVTVHTITGGVFELELDSGLRIKTGRQYSDRVRKLIKPGG